MRNLMTTENIDKASWLFTELIPDSPLQDRQLYGYKVGQVIPPIYDSYCKILHPFQTFIKTSNSETVFENKTWRQIANLYGLYYHDQINIGSFISKFGKIGYPDNLKFPNEGMLTRPLFIDLLDIVDRISTSKEFYIYQSAPNTIWKNDKDCELIKVNKNETLQYFDNGFIGYLYFDRDWIIHTDTDNHYTLVGGHNNLINAICDSNLEAIKLNADSRIDRYADIIN